MQQTCDRDVSPSRVRRRKSRSRPRIVIALEDVWADYQQAVLGATDVAAVRGDIEIFYRGQVGGSVRDEVMAAGGDEVSGLICRTLSEDSIRYLHAQHRPVVLIEQEPIDGLPLVRADNAALGHVGATFLLARGHRRLAYWGIPGMYYSDIRQRAFSAAVDEAGAEIFTSHPPRSGSTTGQFHEAMLSWLSDVPKPLAILVDTTSHARQVVSVCRHLNHAIPEEIAILSCDNDELLGASIHPSISGIDQNMRQVGRQTAELIRRLLLGGRTPAGAVLVAPGGVIERESTNAFAVDDPRLVRALSTIRAEALHGKLSVDHVAGTARLSPRALQLKFRNQLGRTVSQEITRVRIEHARSLLLTTNMSVLAVALQCGYESSEVFTRAFRRVTGTTPRAYRRARSVPPGQHLPLNQGKLPMKSTRSTSHTAAKPDMLYSRNQAV